MPRVTSRESLPDRRPDHAERPASGLRLDPFRAVRYSPKLIDDLAAVTSPPYDVIGDTLSVWESTHPYNVVRLILPREEGNSDSRYRHAARDLREWLARGILVQDEQPALYVYEQADASGLLSRGLIGAVSLHQPGERVVLPHEEVFPAPVADRAALMRATGAQLEPITLVYDGDGPASDVVDAVTTDAPFLAAGDGTGVTHRLWRLTDGDLLQRIAADLRHRRALIADGHHRYAAYLQLCEEFGRSTEWSTGLALLIDGTRHPLRLGAVHRTIAGLTLAEAAGRARAGFTSVQPVAPEQALDKLASIGKSELAVLLTDGTDWMLLTEPDPAQLDKTVDNHRSPTWRTLDASIVHGLLMRELLGVDDSDPRVSYHHEVNSAISHARDAGQVAIVLNPASLSEVLAVAAGGERMPRKSTSFGPKPRTGLVLRRLIGISQ